MTSCQHTLALEKRSLYADRVRFASSPVCVNSLNAEGRHDVSLSALKLWCTKRLRGQPPAKARSSRSVKPKSSWQNRSLSSLSSMQKRKKDDDSKLRSKSSSDSPCSSGATTVEEDAKFSSKTVGTLAAIDIVEMQSESSGSLVSSVEVWMPMRMERQRPVPIIEREVECTDVVLASPHVQRHSKHLPQFKVRNRNAREETAMAQSSRAPGACRQLKMLLPGRGKNEREALALGLFNDSFLAYQIGQSQDM